jgi:periplasmic divalent cation tolerance protein
MRPFWEARIVEDCNDLYILSDTTPVASAADGRRLAQVILERRLGACVQVEEALTSHYRWEGRPCEEPELRLTIKTLPACAAALQALFAQEHPYELPQFLAVAMTASPAYAAWVRAEVSLPAPGGEPDPV